jgi:hypothetical protein
MEFEIAPKSSIAPGLYQIKWLHEENTDYYPMPPLFIIALNKKVDVVISDTQQEVPFGGKSLPIIFDFEHNMPESDITIEGR